jgi:hypothetical protein
VKVFHGFALVLATVCAGAQEPAKPAPNWTLVHLDTAGCSQFLDYSTIKREGSYTKAWFMKSCKEPRHVLDIPASPVYSSDVTLLYLDCSERTIMPVEGTKYAGVFASGNPIEKFQEPVAPEEFIKVVPGTAGEVWLEKACRAVGDDAR